MRNNASFLQRLIPDLQRQGWSYRQGKRHVVLYPADKTKKPFTVSMSPSDVHGRVNAIRDIEKAGGQVFHKC